MLLLIVLGLVLVVVGGARLRLGPAVRAREATSQVWPVIKAYIAGSPATFLYLFVVTVTAWVLATSGPAIDEALLRQHSSNLAALAQSPMRGLIQSALWVEGIGMFLLAWALAALLAPVERWLGTPRWLAVFALGHVGTTPIVAASLWGAARWLGRAGRAPRDRRRCLLRLRCDRGGADLLVPPTDGSDLRGCGWRNPAGAARAYPRLHLAWSYRRVSDRVACFPLARAAGPRERAHRPPPQAMDETGLDL